MWLLGKQVHISLPIIGFEQKIDKKSIGYWVSQICCFYILFLRTYILFDPQKIRLEEQWLRQVLCFSEATVVFFSFRSCKAKRAYRPTTIGPLSPLHHFSTTPHPFNLTTWVVVVVDLIQVKVLDHITKVFQPCIYSTDVSKKNFTTICGLNEAWPGGLC